METTVGKELGEDTLTFADIRNVGLLGANLGGVQWDPRPSLLCPRLSNDAPRRGVRERRYCVIALGIALLVMGFPGAMECCNYVAAYLKDGLPSSP